MLLTLMLIVTTSGCSSLEIIPEPTACNNANTVKSYSLQLSDSFVSKHAYIEAVNKTKKIMSNSTLLDALPESTEEPHLHIKSFHNSPRGGGACAQEYLTGLTLGIIPSWCTREGIFQFAFEKYLKGEIVNKQEYVVDVTSYGHIILLPFGLMQMAITPNYRPLEEYEKALKSNMYNECS